jgi:aspartyl-tRNA(Asn)/glutamyl-tRNA(Gln) amidotransferase subunit A
MTAELWQHCATELAHGYRTGAFSPVEVLEAVLRRVHQVNPLINAIVTLDQPGACAAARASEKRWRSGTALGPLDGVPLTVKDNIPVRGLRATWGSRLYADYVPAEDELPVGRLRAAGAVIVGKTNCPEFTLQGYTDNPVFGPTRNPWDLQLTPGGSSGGAVAAVAAGLGPLAIGTDGGGSIRRPASHTGLVGLKPSRGRVPRCNGFPAILLDFEVVGPIARTVGDVLLAMQTICAYDTRDPAALAFSMRPFSVEAVERSRIRLAPRFANSPVDNEVGESVAQAADNLRNLGHAVEEGEVPFDVGVLDRIWPVISQTGLAWLLQSKPDWRDRVSPALAAVASAGMNLSGTDYFAALDAIAGIGRRLAAFYAEYDVLMTPSAAALPWPAAQTHPTTIAGQAVGPRGHAVFTAFANVTGCPGISVPSKPSAAGLPIGFQLVAAPGRDALLCALAAQYESAHPWAHRRPPI